MFPGETLLRLPAVTAKTGLGRTSIYEMVAAKTFPQPIKIGKSSIGFLNSEIEAWIAGRVRASRGEDVAA